MTTCSRCKEEIIFGSHPVSGKPTPFSMDGEIHFKKCSPPTAPIDLATEKCRAPDCLGKAIHVFWKATAAGKRLYLSYDCHHTGRAIPMIAENISMINIEYPEREIFHLTDWKKHFNKLSVRATK